MDTRTKIIAYEDAVKLSQRRPVRWITGHFDPMLDDHARRVHELKDPDSLLIAVITNSAAPLLDQRARAELVAALADIDYVVLKLGETPTEEPEDAAITQAFIAQVLRRNGVSA